VALLAVAMLAVAWVNYLETPTKANLKTAMARTLPFL
jgi:hypothetical protein